MKNLRTNEQYLKNWAGILGFCWFLLVVGVYFVSHKPFTPEIAINLGGNLWHVFTALAIWLLAGGLGHKFLGQLQLSPLERFAFQSAFGLGFLGTAWLFIGVTLGFGWIQGAIFGLGLLVIVFNDIRAWVSQLSVITSAWKASGRFGKILGGELLVILFVTLTVAAAPPVKFDALVYHLRLPDLYLENGRFFYVPEIMFWGMPQIGEMLFTWAISIGGNSAAAILSWLAGLTTLLGLFGLLKDRLGLSAAWSGLAALLVGFTLASSLSWAYVDWFVILFGTAFLIGLISWLRQRAPRLLIISGAFTGMALATKYTAGILVIAGTFLIIWDAYRQKQFGGVVQLLLLFWAPCLLIFSPWLIKNVLATGSPIYPFIFPAGAMDQIRLDYYQGGQAWGSWLDTIFLPWRATSVGIESAPGYSASIGPFILGLSAWAWLGKEYYDHEAQRFLKNTALILVPVLILWMILGRFSSYLLQTRLYLGIFPVMAVLAGAGFQAFSQLRISNVRLGRITAILVLFIMGLTVFEVSSSALRQGSLAYAAGLTSGQAYRQQNLGLYALAIEEINALPAGSRVVFLWETRSLGCMNSCDPDEILDRWPHDLLAYENIDAIQSAWKNQGYTHVLYYKLGADFLQQEDVRYKDVDWESLDQFTNRLVEVTDLSGAYQIYQIP